MKHIPMQLLFAAALAFASASAAQAFTYESAAPGDGGGATRNYTDPDRPDRAEGRLPAAFRRSEPERPEGRLLSEFRGGRGQTFDQKYNSSDYFDPLKR